MDMKNLKVLVFIAIFGLMTPAGLQAQFLKKLQKSVERGVERAVLKKTEQKVSEKTEDAIDKVFEAKIGGMMKGNMGEAVDPSLIPDRYDFEWKYTLQMVTDNGNFSIDYYFEPDARYFGMKPDMKEKRAKGDMVMVSDMDRNIMTVFMDMGNEKMAMPSSMEIDMNDLADEADSGAQDYTIKELGTKTILGYKCQGFKLENSDMEMIIYAAPDAPVSFNQIYGYGGDVSKAPKGFNPKWLKKMENSLVMEIEYKSKTENRYQGTMRCVALEKQPFTIYKKDYQFMNLNIPMSQK